MLRISSRSLARLREPINWVDIRYAYANQLIDGRAVIDHACRVLSESVCDNDEILAIASAKETDQLGPLIDKVAGLDEPTSGLKQKWALILAAFISEINVDDKLEAIEEIYSLFDYPDELAGLVRYMPMDGPDLGSKEANENRMLETLKELSAKILASG